MPRRAFPSLPPRVSIALAGLLALAMVVALGVVGVLVWHRLHRTPLEQALRLVPAASLRVAFTDWSVVRSQVRARLGDEPSPAQIDAFMAKAYDQDLSAASSIDEAATALQANYGFGPVNAQWEAYAQARGGAAMVLKVAQGTDFGILAHNLRVAGYKRPAHDDGVWKGGIDLVSQLDPTISPELQYVVLLEDQGLVVTSDTASYAAKAARVASGDADGLGQTDKVDGLADSLGRPANAMIWAGDFACEDLAMSHADADAREQADQLIEKAGGVTPLRGLAMSMSPHRRLRVVAGFESSRQARENLRPRARLAVGEAVGRGTSFADTFTLVGSRTAGSTIQLDLRPKDSSQYVLSAVDDGPVIFASC